MQGRLSIPTALITALYSTAVVAPPGVCTCTVHRADAGS